MPNRRKVNFQGQMVDAESVEFEADKELWSTYILHDGTALKIKAVLTDVSRLEGIFSPNGRPRYIWSKPHRSSHQRARITAETINECCDI